MKYEPQQVLSQFESKLKESLFSTFSQWQIFHSNKLEQLQKILDPLKVHLVQSAEWTDVPVELWKEIQVVYTRICKWIDENHYIPENLTAEELCAAWYAEFEKILETLPEEIRIVPGETYWLGQKSDGLYVRFRKRLLRVGRWLAARTTELRNLKRRIRKQGMLERPRFERLIPLRNFSIYFIQAPLTEFMIEEWQQFMQSVSGQLFVMQAKNEELSERVLLLEKFKEILDAQEPLQIFDELFLLAEVLKHMDETLQALNGYERQFKNRLDNAWEKISTRFETYWHRAGTYRFKTKTLKNERLLKVRLRIEDSFKRFATLWLRQWQGLRGNWTKDLQLAALQLHMAIKLVQICRSASQKIHQQIKPKYEHLHKTLKKAETKYLNVSNTQQLTELINSEKDKLLYNLQRKILPDILDTIQQNQLIELFGTLNHESTQKIQNLAEEYAFFLHKDTSGIPPNSRIDTAPVKEIVESEIIYDFKADYGQIVDLAKENIEKIYRMISEIDQVIEFNFEAAQNLINSKSETKIDEIQKIIIGGFQRTENLVGDIRNETGEIAESSTSRMREITLDFIKDIQELSDNQKVHSLKIRLARAKTRQKIHHLLLKSKKISPTISSFFKRLWNHYILFRKMTGIEKPEQIIEEQLVDFLTESKEKIDRLPYVYQRLFRFEPLSDERFFTGREHEIQLLQTEYREWNTGKHALTALVGERGSGRTSLINFILKKVFSGKEPVQFDFEQPFTKESNLLAELKRGFVKIPCDSIEELILKINELPEKHICIIENMQNTFLKVVDGFKALETLIYFITRTQDKIFWIISCTSYTWHYLDRVVHISRNFHKIIPLGTLSTTDIQNIILKRHRVSGFSLEFSYFDELSKIRRFRKRTSAEARQAFLQEYFFNSLNDIAEGNITMAMLYWLRSIRQFTRDRVIIKTDLKFDFNFLHDLPDDDLFSLAAIIMHDKMTVENHARLFHKTPGESQVELNRLFRFGFLQISEGSYRINPLLYRPLERTLRSKSILH